jgi:hypothetical protein
MSLEQIQAEVSKIGQSWEAFKAANEERLKVIEKNQGTGEVDAKLEKINASLNTHEDALRNSDEAAKKRAEEALERYNEMERKVNLLHQGALAGGGEKVDKVKADAGKFFLAKTGKAPTEDVDTKAYQEYTQQFGAYLRNGEIN